MDNVFDYEDIQLIPAKSIVKSRSECYTSVEFGGHKVKLPVVPANMKTLIDEKIAILLAENGYFYIMHRFQPETRLDFVKDMQARGLIASISVGVKEGEYEFVQRPFGQYRSPTVCGSGWDVGAYGPIVRKLGGGFGEAAAYHILVSFLASEGPCLLQGTAFRVRQI